MKAVAAALAFAAVAVAAPQASSSSFSPAEATLELYSVLPSSIQALALTNPGAASTAIADQFATGTPTWFTVLPTDVQSYFLAQTAPTITSSVPLSTGTSGNASSSVTGKFTNSSTSTTTKLSTSSSSITTSASASKASTGSSSSSSGGAAVPTAMIGGSLAGLVGLVGMLAL